MHYWTALKYTKPMQFRTTLAFKDNKGDIAVSKKAKKALVRISAFRKPLSYFFKPPAVLF